MSYGQHQASLMRKTALLLAMPICLLSLSGTASCMTIHVGPSHPIKTIANASLLAQSGDTVEVDAGDYVGDVATWRQSNLTLRAVGGRVRLIADGASAGSKAIWVVRGKNFAVEGFDFVGAKVKDRNGAGIRFEKGNLLVRDCTFMHNENGILTGNDPALSLTIENSEFGHNGYGDGFSHSLYVGEVAQLTVTGSYFHHGKSGHLLKSRAIVNLIAYNRLTDGNGGTASYELEFPNGGVAYVVGNIIQQSRTTRNPHMISFGVEGYKYPINELYLINNTLIDDLPYGGVFLRLEKGAGKVELLGNQLIGRGEMPSFGPNSDRSEGAGVRLNRLFNKMTGIGSG
jgi:Right handed beta helix region